MDGQADTKEGANAVRAAFASVIPLGRMGQPEEVLPPRTSWPRNLRLGGGG
jgi:hypothetical protein